MSYRLLPTAPLVRIPAVFVLGVVGGAVLMSSLLLVTTVFTGWFELSIPAPATATTSTPAVVPERLHIPALSIDTSFTEPLGLQTDGTIAVPDSHQAVGWYQYGPIPGEIGPAVILGHVSAKRETGVFYDLWRAVPGDRIDITLSDGTVETFVVDQVQYLSQKQFPTASVYGDIQHAGLRLITCGGSYNPLTKRYTHNVVVFAQAAPGNGAETL